MMELQPLARDALPTAHFGYIATGLDDDLTVARNRTWGSPPRNPLALTTAAHKSSDTWSPRCRLHTLGEYV
jgi:hypothetical protein